MHKARFNALQLRLEVRPSGPLLVKAGGLSPNPALPDMQFVRTHRPSLGETVYLPGSSLKGAVRGFCEKVLRTLDAPDGWRRACPTFPSETASCARRLETERDSAAVYRGSCGACRLFGHTRLRGRLAFSDFFPANEVPTETRFGIAVSRLSHAVAQGPFEIETAVGGAFAGRLSLENYELWQLGLLGLALESMNQGLLKLGFGKNRGFGEVAVAVVEAVIDEAGPESDDLRGVGAFVSDAERQRYGLAAPHRLEGLPAATRTESLGLYHRRGYDADAWQALIRRAIAALSPGAAEADNG